MEKGSAPNYLVTESRTLLGVEKISWRLASESSRGGAPAWD